MKGGNNAWRHGSRICHCAFVLCFAVFALLSAASVRAQDLGSIVGTVTDPSGAAIPGIEVEITNTQTGVVARKVTTNSAGNYAFSDLIISTYSIKAQGKGFQTVVHSGVVLNVGSVLRVDIQMPLGSLTQEVSVTAAALHVQTENGVEKQTISGQHVSQIDTNGRNFIQLAALVPGAAAQLPSFNTPVGVTAATGISFNGERPSHNVWSIDGIDNYDRGCGGCVEVVPDQDAIQEFTVQSSNMSQNIGFGSGGNIQVEIKGGTNKYHGEAFEFNRNTAMDASTFFANKSGATKPTLNFNDFGFNLGGPVALPGHDKKTFFFFEGDWRNIRQGSTIFAPAVPAAWTTGDFSSYGSVILDHTKPVTLPNGQIGYQPFPNNQIPASMFDPNAAKLAAPGLIFPSPNTSTGFYAATPTVPINVNEQIVRIDHQFSDKTSMMVHYIRDGINQSFPTSLWTGDTYPTVGTNFLNEPQSVMLRLTRTISPTLLNEFTVAFNRQPLTLLPTGTYVQPSGLSLQPIFTGNNTDNRIPVIHLAGPALNVNYDTGSWPWTNVLNTWVWRDTLSKTAGNHTLNFGGEYEHYMKEQELFGNTNGNYTFNGSGTSGSYLGPNGQILTTRGNEFADMMLGSVYSYTQLQKQTMPAYLNNFYGLWSGDDWKVRQGLTLNLGLRWEGMPHAYEQYNNISVFRPSLFSASQIPQFTSSGSIVPNTGNLLNGIGIAGQNGIPPGLVQNHWANFEPRVGFAYQPFKDGKTVIRGGYGIFYENIQGNDIYNVAPNPPFSNSPQIFDTNFSNPGLVPGTIFPGNVQAYDPQYLQPYSQQWSAGIERQLNPQTVFSIMYVGSKGTDQQITTNINQPFGPVTSGPLNLGRPYLGFANIGWYQNSTNSSYNSLQASLRFSNWHGLTSGVAYTWSHCLDFADNDVPGFINNSYNVAAEYGNCGYNIPQMLVINYVYTLPIARGATGASRTLLSGWQVSGISTFYAGSPLTIGFPGDPAECGCGGYRANVISNPNIGPGTRTANLWFNPAAFAAVPIGSFGDSARNIVNGTPLYNWDMSLFKNFAGIPFPKTPEGATIQFRAEVFNTFNTAEFNGFFTTYGAQGFGQPSSTRDPREIQLGLKFIF